MSDLGVTAGSTLGLNLTTAEVSQTEEEGVGETGSSQQTQDNQGGSSHLFSRDV